MAEAHQARVHAVVEDMVQSLERDHIRVMQVGVLTVTTWTVHAVLYLSTIKHLYDALNVCVLAAGSHVQVQCRLLWPLHWLHVCGA